MGKQIDSEMHTVEHILNQTMDRMFKCGRCFSAHIGKKKSKCDYRFDRPLSQPEVREIEYRVNAIIQRGLLVTEEWISFAEAKGKYSLKRLPADVDEKIRIVKIGDYDACSSSIICSKTFALVLSSFSRQTCRN